jgi:MFS family permease
MQILFALQQSVASDPAITPDQLGLAPSMVIVGALIGAVIGGLILGIILKFVGQAVLGGTVKFSSAFSAMFIYSLITSAVGFAAFYAGMVHMSDLQAAKAGGMNAIMPYGLPTFIASTAVGILLIGWTVRVFVRDPEDRRPSWGSALIIAVIMSIIGLVLSLLLSRINPGMRG